MSPETIHQLVTAYFTHMQAMNLDAWVANFTDDAVIYDPVGKPPNNAKDLAPKFFGLLSAVFETLELTADQLFTVDNGAAVKWTMRGVGKNGRQGIAEGISVFEMHESGKIQQVSSYWDDAAMMAQIRG